nr:hypothetical protein [Acanthopleuribacter pedis]
MTGAVCESELLRFLAEQTGIEEVDLFETRILPHILKKMPQKLAEQYNLIPLDLVGNRLLVACADPTDDEGLSAVARITGHVPKPYLTTYSSILRAIHQFYLGIPVPERSAGMPGKVDAFDPFITVTVHDSTQPSRGLVNRFNNAPPGDRLTALFNILIRKGLITENELAHELGALAAQRHALQVEQTEAGT